MKYKQFTLDKFQEDAIRFIEQNKSVVVSAATGTGKTLIADYIINKAIKTKKCVIYTAPIKALSNQKYRDFVKEYGEEKIGIMTGDVTINERAPILLMTTEIYRNMLLEHQIVPNLSYVVFDEIHYMMDPERGTVWEESIIFSPPYVRFLCLSATIPNARQFADWIQTIKKHKVSVVNYMKRAVPLKHYLFDNDEGIIEAEKLRKIVQMEMDGRAMRGRRRRRRPQPNPPNHLYLISDLYEQDLLPTIFFVLSRKLSREYAQECAKEFDFTSKKEKEKIIDLFSKYIPVKLRGMRSIQQLRKMLIKGVAMHNAGMFPRAKELVEVLFGEGLVSVLYSTETFALGINMPARSTCINSMRKYDGRSFRYMYSKEYFQMAGRAGRRGIDVKGHVFAMVDKNAYDLNKIISLTKADSEPMISQFKLSYNMVLNIVNDYDEHQIDNILKQNFDYFLQKQKNKKQIRIKAQYNNMVKRLKRYSYIEKDGRLTGRGKFARKIYANELLITELLFEGVFSNFSESDLNVLIAGIVYEPRRLDKFNKVGTNIKIKTDNQIIKKELKWDNIKKVDALVRAWSDGCEFRQLFSKCNLQEGDLIRFFRQIIDRLSQIKKAEHMITDKLNKCIERIDRDEVSIVF